MFFMDTGLFELIDLAIDLELNIGKLYSLFSQKFPEDRSFWAQLEVEEYNHAALLKAAKNFVKVSKFPIELIPDQSKLLKQSITHVLESYEKFEKKADRFEALSTAYDIEISAGEMHYQQFMKSTKQDEITNIFQQLNRADYDHSKKILNYQTEINQYKQ